MKKKLIFLLSIFVLFPSLVNASVTWHSGASGSGAHGRVPVGTGEWNSMTVGVRVTFVDSNGDRLKLTVGGKTYVSISKDYYADLSQVSNGYLSNVQTTNSHSVCDAGGVETLCNKKEVALGVPGDDGGYKYEQWPYRVPLVKGSYCKNEACTENVIDLTTTFRELSKPQYNDIFNDLFKQLMGISIDDIQRSSVDNCSENRNVLETAYLIYEPLGQIGPFTGTATELGLINYNDGNFYHHRAIPLIYNAVYIPKSTGSLGLKYYESVSGALPVAVEPYSSSPSAYQSRLATSNNKLGRGIGILKYSDSSSDIINKFNCYNYSIDMACANCDSKKNDSKAYIIQDTTDWNAILNSQSISVASDCANNLKNYFVKDSENGIFCREEYHVFFPNASNITTVQLGRYFTLNASYENLVSIPADIPNFKPVKVTRVRECKNKDNDGNKLNVFKARTDKKVETDCTGDIVINYTEKNKITGAKKYVLDKTILTRYNKADSFTSKVRADGVLEQKVTYSYTLPFGIYQYVKKEDGKAVKKTTSDDIYEYQDLKISTLPVSFTSSESNISLQFAFSLPKSCNDSKMSQVYIKDNNKLTCGKTTDNIYKKYNEGKVSANDLELLSSACVKLYGSSGLSDSKSDVRKCIAARTSNKMGKCFIQNNIDNKDNYSCEVYDDSKCDKNTPGRSWNVRESKCCSVGYIYDSITGTCRPSNGVDDCNINTPYHFWNEKDGKCCPYGKVYDSKTESCVSRTCTGHRENCPDGTCGVRVNGVLICSPSFDSGFVPYSSAVYRTINLQHPFIGQLGKIRSTGSNWCNYNIDTKQFDCSNDNSAVRAVISNSKSVYSDSHVLYEVTLNTETINKIRDYNKNNRYDDFKLDCKDKDNGDACFSKFLRDKNIFYGESEITGNCSSIIQNVDNFYSCTGFKG